MPKQNEVYEVALQVAAELKSLDREARDKPGIPFGMETLSARDHARRVFKQMSPEERRRELERVGMEEMVKLARTYRRGQPLEPPQGAGPIGIVPPGGG